MRKLIVYAACILAIAASCTREADETASGDSALEERSVAVEILSDYLFSDYDRPIDPETDSDFIDEEVEAAMKDSRFYRNCPSGMTKAGADTPDTLKYSEQIPFIADVEESTVIFLDGSSEYVKSTDLDPETNPLLNFHESELDLSTCIAKTEIKDGCIRTFNNKGEILSESEIQMPDYSEYLEELEECKKESAAETRAGQVKRDIDWLRARMAAQSPTKAGEDASYSIYEKDGMVVLEQHTAGTKAGEDITVRTFLSNDITRNYGFEKLENGTLKMRCRHTFPAVSSSRTRSSNIPIDGISDENPSRTVIEELSYLSDGTPMVKVSDKEFKVNTVNYNIK